MPDVDKAIVYRSMRLNWLSHLGNFVATFCKRPKSVVFGRDQVNGMRGQTCSPEKLLCDWKPNNVEQRCSTHGSKRWHYAVLGNQNGGTTDLAIHLAAHSQVCVRDEARVMKFLMANCSKNISWQEVDADNAVGHGRAFQAIPRGTAGVSWRTVGFSGPPKSCRSTSYLVGGVDPSAAFAFAASPAGARVLGSMLDASPNMKLVLLLREPLQRALSAHLAARARATSANPKTLLAKLVSGKSRDASHGVEHGIIFARTMAAETAWTMQPNVTPPVQWSKWFSPLETLRHGLYGAQIAALRSAGLTVPGPNVLVLIAERMRNSLERELRRVWLHLGLVPETPLATQKFELDNFLFPTDSLKMMRLFGGWKSMSMLYDFYWNSTTDVYAALGEEVSEWEGWYEDHGLPNRQEERQEEARRATKQKRRAAKKAARVALAKKEAETPTLASSGHPDSARDPTAPRQTPALVDAVGVLVPNTNGATAGVTLAPSEVGVGWKQRIHAERIAAVATVATPTSEPNTPPAPIYKSTEELLTSLGLQNLVCRVAPRTPSPTTPAFTAHRRAVRLPAGAGRHFFARAVLASRHARDALDGRAPSAYGGAQGVR